MKLKYSLFDHLAVLFPDKPVYHTMQSYFYTTCGILMARSRQIRNVDARVEGWVIIVDYRPSDRRLCLKCQQTPAKILPSHCYGFNAFGEPEFQPLQKRILTAGGI